MIFAIDAALDAIPVNPNKAATMAIIRKITVHRNIVLVFKLILIAIYNSQKINCLFFKLKLQLTRANVLPLNSRFFTGKWGNVTSLRRFSKSAM